MAARTFGPGGRLPAVRDLGQRQRLVQLSNPGGTMSRSPHGPVSTIMSWPVATIDHDATLEEAAEALSGDDIGVLLALRDGDPAGIASERDIVAHVAAGSELTHLRVGEVMA